MNKKNRFNRKKIGIRVLVALCLLTCVSVASAEPRFEITKAEWRTDRLELKVEGIGSEGETVNVFNAVTDALIGSATVNHDDKWKLLLNSPASVPCRVGAESEGMVDEKAVKNAPDDCDETAPGCTDNDNDGYSIEGGDCGPVDCNDDNPDINPDAIEDCTDGIDNDCDGLIDSADPDAVNCPDILSENFFALHDSSSRQYNKHCSECHADVHTAESFDPSIPTAHVAMFDFAPGKPGDDKQCRWCHRTVDLTQGTQPEEKSKGNLRRDVDVTVCTLCHGPSGPATQFYETGLSPTDPDGPLLYDLTCAACHRDLEDSQVRGESARDIQKKIDENKGGMGPLDVLSPEEIEAIAAALAP